MSAAAAELRRYRHVFFDIQNEFNGRITHVSDDEARRLGLAMKKADPKRIVTASLANEIGPEDVAKRSDSVDADVVGLGTSPETRGNSSRWTNWFDARDG